MTIWVVPGAPLATGKGWRIWYSWASPRPFRPAPVGVTRDGTPEPTSQADWVVLPDEDGLERRIGVLTVELANPNPGVTYDIDIPEAGRPLPLRWRSMSAVLEDAPVTFLLASCF